MRLDSDLSAYQISWLEIDSVEGLLFGNSSLVRGSSPPALSPFLSTPALLQSYAIVDKEDGSAGKDLRNINRSLSPIPNV